MENIYLILEELLPLLLILRVIINSHIHVEHQNGLNVPPVMVIALN
jgi:hypothetical protein